MGAGNRARLKPRTTEVTKTGTRRVGVRTGGAWAPEGTVLPADSDQSAFSPSHVAFPPLGHLYRPWVGLARERSKREPGHWRTEHLSHKGHKCIKMVNCSSHYADHRPQPLPCPAPVLRSCHCKRGWAQSAAGRVRGPGCSLCCCAHLSGSSLCWEHRPSQLAVSCQPPALGYGVTDKGYRHFPQQRNLGPLVPTFLFWRCFCPQCSSQCP